MLAEECEDLVPAVERLLHPVHGTVIIENAVAGAIVAMELVGLAVLLEFGFVLVHLLRAWCAILIAEKAKQGTGEILGEFNGRGWGLGVELLLAITTRPPHRSAHAST